MTEGVEKPAAAVIEALQAGDPMTAQSLLDKAGPALRNRKRRALQARIHLARGEAGSAVDLLRTATGDAPPSRSVRTRPARANVAGADPADAPGQTERPIAAKAPPRTLAEAIIRISALAALNERQKTVEAVDLAFRDYPKASTRPGPLIKALLEVDALEDAARHIGNSDLSRISDDALCDFTGRCLCQCQPALMQSLLHRVSKEKGIRFEKVIQGSFKLAETPPERANAGTAICGFVDSIEAPEPAFRLTTALYRLGFVDAADKALVRFKDVSQGHTAASLMSTDTLDALVPRQRDQRLQLVMDWLNIPQDQRQEWLSRAAQGVKENSLRKYLLAASPDYLGEFRQSLEPADLSPLEDMSRQKRPAILATSHAGVLMGTLQHLVSHQLPVFIMGGHHVLNRMLPGGELLDPISRDQSPTSTARKVIGHIRSGRIVGLAADGRKGIEQCSHVHRGHLFDLPDSIPQMAFRYQVPVIWTVTYWRENRLSCDCTEGPSPRPGEAFEAYRERWFTFLMDRIYGICHADPRNITFNPEMLRAAVS